MWNRIDGLRVIAFGTPGPLRDELNGLVLSGLKTGTAGHHDSDYVREGEPLEQPGERLAVVDNDDRQIATIRVTAVQTVAFEEVSDEFARSEGEGFDGHEDWALAHRRYWTRAGLAVAADTPVVCLSFALETGAHPGMTVATTPTIDEGP